MLEFNPCLSRTPPLFHLPGPALDFLFCSVKAAAWAPAVLLCSVSSWSWGDHRTASCRTVAVSALRQGDKVTACRSARSGCSVLQQRGRKREWNGSSQRAPEVSTPQGDVAEPAVRSTVAARDLQTGVAALRTLGVLLSTPPSTLSLSLSPPLSLSQTRGRILSVEPYVNGWSILSPCDMLCTNTRRIIIWRM